MNDHHPAPQPRQPRFWGSRFAIGFVVFAGIGVHLLLSEHRAHFAGALPFVLLLACPLLHVFMRGSHGGHDHGAAAKQPPAPPPPPNGAQP